MKKMKAFLFAAVLVLLFMGCTKTGKEELAVYSFHGANEEITVFNGILIVNGEEQIFKGGYLKFIGELPKDIVSYSTTFYMNVGKGREAVYSNKVEDMGGGTVELTTDLGKAFGSGVINKTMLGKRQEWKNPLSFELKIKDRNGEDYSYFLELSLTEEMNRSK